MIHDTQLTFARISKGTISKNYIFAHTGEPMRPGERTSDFLGFFGFGSGQHDGNLVVKEMDRCSIILFPIEDNYTRDSALLLHLLEALGHEYYIEPTDYQKVFYYMAAAHGKNYSTNVKDIPAIGSQTRERLYPLVIYGAHQDGRRFYGIGFNNQLFQHRVLKQFLASFHLAAYPIKEFPYADWDNWTSVSNIQHARGVFGGLRRLHFMAESMETQNLYISNLETEALRIIDYVG